jgi:serine protease
MTHTSQGSSVRKALVVLGVASLSSLLLSAPAFAGHINLSGLASADTHTGFIVKYRDQAATSTASLSDARSTVLSRSLSAASRAVPARNGRALGVSKVRDLAVGPTLVRADRGLDRAEAEQLMRAIAADPAVEYVEVDQILHPVWTPNDPSLGTQWGFNGTYGIKAAQAWDLSRGAGAVIGIIDTGSTSHPDLNGNTLAGYDFIANTTTANDGGGRDADASDPGDWNTAGQCGTGSVASNSSWHGTHVAGTAAAVTNNGVGGAGTAPEAKLVHARVLGRCGGSTSDIADAVIWASGGTVSGVPANPNPAEVVNLSLGGSGSCGTTMQSAINGAVARGTTVVIAAGNSNANVSGFTPANCANVIAVASITNTGARSSFSNYGAGIDVAAPGSSIYSTLNAGTTSPGAASYASYNGTSMAAPHVAGVVALMQSAASCALTPAQIETIIKNTASGFPSTPSQTIGSGILNAQAAVQGAIAACGGTTPNPEPNPDPGTGNALQNGVTVSGISGAASSAQYWTITVPAGRSSLVVNLSGGTGDADLYVRQGSQPTTTTYACRPYLSGNNETCTINTPVAGTYHVMIRGYSAFTGTSLRATW